MKTSKTILCRNIRNGTKERVPVSKVAFRPSVYGVVVKGSKVLLVKQWDGYDFPGGGMEIGETIDQALKREVWEETGLRVENDAFLACGEDFFTHHYTGEHFQSILLYYLCKNPKGTISTDHFDEYERKYAEKAEWVERKRIRGLKFYNPVGSVDIIKKAFRLNNKNLAYEA